MPLFDQYTKPGVYIREQIQDAGIPLFGSTRIPVLIGEGEEKRTFTGINLHRGSSSYADESVVRENISDQVTGLGRTFTLNYTPVVKGDGKGTVTNDPKDIKVYANGVPLLVSRLNGVTGEFQTQNILPDGTDLRSDYYFKRSDTYIVDEDLSSQVPTFATLALQSGDVVVTPSVPGALGNSISVATTMVVADKYIQGLRFYSDVTGPDGTAISVEIQSGVTLGVAATGAAVLITVAAGSTLADVKALFPIAATLVGGTANVHCSNPNSVNETSLVAVVSPQSLSLTGVTDSLALSGLGTDAISVELVKPNGSLRTKQDLVNLLNTGVLTASGGILKATLVKNGSVAAAKASASLMTLGFGPNTNTTFSTSSAPIVDGSNGGVVTTSPNFVTVKVNGLPVQVTSVDGLNGLITVASPVLSGARLTISYYTNNYQDTFDVLPGDNIVDINNVGYGSGRSDFVDGVDFILEKDSKGAKIQWGASASVKSGAYTAGYTPFDATVLTTTLVDEKVYLKPAQGAVNGKNYSFKLIDVPTDGSGLSRSTDDPTKIQVYVGVDPVSAFNSGAVRVTSLHGDNKTFNLYNPPAAGNNVYASYWVNNLNDHLWTLSVINPGVTGQGTYHIKNESNQLAPVATVGASSVNEANFQTTGIVWPFSFSDLRGVAGSSPDETVTLTFQDDSLNFVVQNAVQATDLQAQPGLRFRATNTGSGPNTHTQIVLSNSGGPTTDSGAVSRSGEVITIQIINGSSSTRTLQDVINLFTSPSDATQVTTPLAGRIICEPASPSVILTQSASVNTATAFAGGAAATTTPYSNRFKVTSSRTSLQSLADGFGLTGGASTPVTSNVGVNSVGSIGYLGQTYQDVATGVKFTIVDPNAALAYGYTSLPSPSYHYRPGDTIVFNLSSALARPTSAIPTIDVPGLRVKVTSTYGMETNSTALVQTYNKAGAEPKIGEFYYVDYTTQKTADDFSLKLFTSLADAYTEYGDPTPTNKLSLASRLFTQNGGQIFGCIQVPKQIGLDTASDQAFTAAIDQLAMPLPGSENKAGLIIPLTTSPVVQQYLNRHLLTQATERFAGEAIGYIGFDIYSTPNDARAITRAINSDRIVAVFPGAAIITLEIGGIQAEFAVTGEFIAAALAGMDCNPINDVATSLTRKNIVGFDRLVKRYDDITMDMAAADGVCWLVERSGALQIRHYITTNPSNPITREPTNRKVADEVGFRLRRNLDQFIARKILTSLINDITVTVNATMKAMIEQELVEGYRDLVVKRDASDPTVIHVSLAFKPVFSLMWLDVNLTVTTKI